MSVNVPIMSDETGKKLVEAQKAANVTSREIRQLLSDQNEILTQMTMLEVPAIAEYEEGETTPTVYKPALTGEEIVAAHKAGKRLVLSIYDATKKVQYRILLSSATLKGGIMWQFSFASTDGNNPLDASVTFVVSYIISSSTLSINATPN